MKITIFVLTVSLVFEAHAQAPGSSVPDQLMEAGLPLGTMFGGDDQGHLTSCMPPTGVKRTSEFNAACSRYLAARGKAVGVSPLDAQSWKIERPAGAPAEATGTSIVRLAVSTEGVVESCSVVTSSGYPILDAAACEQLIPQAHFRPAKDHDGKPITSTYTRPVTWQ